MSDLPEPLVPADCDCTDLDGFMLNVERLMASELVALSTHEVVAAALFLWCRAWKQRPAASLPDDDRVIAAFARLPLPRFKKLREEVMRGFVKCRDGRFYHRVLAQEAMKAFANKAAFRQKRERDAERLRNWREKQDKKTDETHHETPSETCFVADGNGQDRDGTVRDGTVSKKDYSDAGASGAEPPPDPPPIDPLKVVFDQGVGLLKRAGVAERQGRAVLGRWVKAHGAGTVIDALHRASVEQAVEPIAFIEGIFRNSSRGTVNGKQSRPTGSNGFVEAARELWHEQQTMGDA